MASYTCSQRIGATRGPARTDGGHLCVILRAERCMASPVRRRRGGRARREDESGHVATARPPCRSRPAHTRHPSRLGGVVERVGGGVDARRLRAERMDTAGTIGAWWRDHPDHREGLGTGDRGPGVVRKRSEGGRERWWGRAGRTAAFDPVLFEPPFSGLPPTPLSFLFGRFAANSFRRSPPPRPPLPLPPPSPLPRPLPLPPPSGLAAPVAASPSFSSSASRSSAWRRCGRQTSTALDKARHWRARVIPTASDPTLQRADGATRRARGGAHLVIQLLLGVAAARPAALLDAKPLARRQLDVGRSWSSVVVAHVVVDGVALVEEGPLALRACQ